MRISHHPRRRLFPLLLATAALAACDRVNAPDAPRRGTAGSPLAARSGMGGTDSVPVAVRADFNRLAGAAPIACQPNMYGMVHTIASSRYVGSGTATHLGASTVNIAFTSCLTIYATPPGTTDMLVFEASGPLSFAAANGDSLFGNGVMKQYYSGRFVIDSIVLTGGTGRFGNATGRLAGEGAIDRTTLVGTLGASGVMSRPNL